ncbi:MAG: DUF4956 domain-containing protein [Oscillospiraceae bacterium]|nr:DUF4956 domain-containing protein [Oscillospiraceae bacterium]
MISFADILKGNILTELSAISPGGMLTAVGLAFVLSLFIIFIYRITYTGVSFSKGFAGCLVMIAMVTAVVIQVITSNVVLSLGMVGALSIVRFRTAVKEPADTAFLFWAIADGIICGAGYVTIAILATAAVGLLYVALHFLGKKAKVGSFMVIARWDRDCSAEEELSAMPGYQLKNKTMNDDMEELIAEMRLGDKELKKLSEIQKKPGVREVSVMHSVSGSVL